MVNKLGDLITNVMKDNEFAHMYQEILNVMGYTEDEDSNARDYIKEIVNSRINYSLQTQLQNFGELIASYKRLWVFGGGIGTQTFLKDHLGNIPKQFTNQILIIAIDGAATILSEHGLKPHIIFTDLDGFQYDDITKYKLEDSFFIVHAHGDNIDKIEKFQPFLKRCENLITSTQTQSDIPVINHGGFTDGDRAIYLIDPFLTGEHKIYLFGYDFGEIIGQHSKPDLKYNAKVTSVKRKKLNFGRKIIDNLCENSKGSFFAVTFGEKIHLECNILQISTYQDLL